MTTKLEQIAKQVIEAISEHSEADCKELYESLSKGNKSIAEIKDPQTFWFHNVNNFNRYIEGLISTRFPKSQNMSFLLRNYEFVEHHFCKLIIKEEGSSCSSDKSRTILKYLFDYFETGTVISFDYNQEYTYHLPKNILKTHEAIISCFEALHELYYGKPDKYLKILQKIIFARNELEKETK